MCAGAAVSWFSKNQRCVTLSTTESEYIALGDGAMEGLFIRGLLSFMVPSMRKSMIQVFGDNQGAIKLANNPHSSARSRHIDVRHHFLRELVRKKTIEIEHVESRLQHADGLTKPLETTIFRWDREFLLNCG